MGGIRDSATAPPYLTRDTSRPSAEDQVRFIENIERILSDGSFVATYKYALLVALVELAIERGDDTNDTLELSTRDIADKLAELYWPQSAPYESHRSSLTGMVLHQATGRQARVVTELAKFRDGLETRRPTFVVARQSHGWKALIGRIKRSLEDMPLWRLQKIGNDDLRFLYVPGVGPDKITLLPGVACILRARAPLIRRLAQSEWLRFVLSLPQNQPALGRAVGLSRFLFGSDRSALSQKVSTSLRDLQQGACFYCGRALAPSPAVDHFIPWSRYPHDLIHNLVLAHKQCNADKSDWLGGEAYLERWVEHVARNDTSLQDIGGTSGLLVDRATSIAVAEWSYGHAERVRAEVWLGGRNFGLLSERWRGLLS